MDADGCKRSSDLVDGDCLAVADHDDGWRVEGGRCRSAG